MNVNADRPALLNHNCPECNSVLFPIGPTDDVLAAIATNDADVDRVECPNCAVVYEFDDVRATGR